jgi:hypothetical protein
MKKVILVSAVTVFAFAAMAQNVGIGTITPVDKLSVVTPGAGYGITHEGMGKKLGTYIDANGGWLGTQTTDPLHFFTANGLAQITLLTNGNVGIGITNPMNKLEVNGNITGANFNLSSPKTYYYSLSGADFIEVVSGTGIPVQREAGGGIYMLGSALGIVAPVHLPHNATVTRMTVYFFDGSASVNLDVSLRNSDGAPVLANIITVGAPGNSSLIDNTIDSPVILNSGSAYKVKVLPSGGDWDGTSLVLLKVIIEYTLNGL